MTDNITVTKESKMHRIKAISIAAGIAVLEFTVFVLVTWFWERGGTPIITGNLRFIYAAAVLTLCFSVQYMYLSHSARKLFGNLKEYGASMAAQGFSVCVGLVIGAYTPLIAPVLLTALLMSAMARKRDAFSFNMCANIELLALFMLICNQAEVLFVVANFIVGVSFGGVAAYALRSDLSRVWFVIKSVAICASAAAVVVGLCAIVDYTQIKTVSVMCAFALAAQIVLSLIFQPILESAFNLVTDQRLIELCNHNSPLVKKLKEEAPGTFSHSLSVANFAETCAAAIGENPYLARAAAYYHDVGKTLNAEYFTENQAGVNAHDNLLPEVSAEIIRKHTSDGYKLCKQYKIPEEVSSVAIEHHGTLMIAVFYQKAKSLTDSEVKMDEYRYRGKTPESKISALIMVCDACEAAIRAMDKPDGEKVDALVNSIINDRIAQKQFDNCPITMRDLKIVRETIVGGYGGLYHSRIKYPEGKK